MTDARATPMNYGVGKPQIIVQAIIGSALALTVASSAVGDSRNTELSNSESTAESHDTVMFPRALPILSLSDARVSESESHVSVRVHLSHASTDAVTLSIFTRPGTAQGGSDYVGDTQLLTFNPGVTEQSFDIAIINDSTREPTETMTVAITDVVNANVAESKSIVTIEDDNDQRQANGTLSIAPTVVAEDDGTARIAVRLSEPATDPVTVLAFTQRETAEPGQDYYGTTRLLSFAAGETVQHLEVVILDDSLVETTERIGARITAASGAEIGPNRSAIVTLVDNDGGTDGTTDGGTDGTTDGGTDGTTDGGTDGTTDGGTDGTTDGGTDGTTDGGTDGTTDGGTDGTTDGGTDGTTDGGTDGNDLRVRRQYQVSNTVDPQPAVPPLPAIAEFVDMPATGGSVEVSRIVSNGGDNSREHLYARRSSFDPFDKYILTSDYLYKLADFSEFKRVPFGYEYVAAQTEEDVFYGYRGNKFQKWNAVTDIMTTIYTAPAGMSSYTIGNYEGGLSWNDRYAPLVWRTGNGFQITIVDLTTGSAVGSIHSSEVNDSELNWVDVSPTGKYVLVGMNNQVYRFNTDLTDKTPLNARSGGNAHGDTLYDVIGNEVFAQEGNYYNGQISYTILDSNINHVLNVVDTASQSGVDYPNSASHISGQARNKQGLLFVSLQETSGMSNMFATYLIPDQTEIYHFGHTYTQGRSYANQAKASINNSATMIIWTSDWMSGGLTHEFLARQK